MRIPAATQLIARTSDVTIDARAFNGVIEAGDVVKRPGVFSTHYDFSTPIQGALGINGGLVLIYDDEFAVTEIFWSALASYSLGDIVWYMGSMWEATADSTGSAPFDGSSYWAVTFVGSNCEFNSTTGYVINDSVCYEDPTTGRLTKFYATTDLSSAFPPKSSGWKSRLWKRGRVTVGQKYWTNSYITSVAYSPEESQAAYLAGGAVGNFPRSGVDGLGRNWTETITDTDLIGPPNNAYQTLQVFDPNPPYPGGSANQLYSMNTVVYP